MITESLELDKLTFEVRRSPRRRSLELMVDRGGALRIYAPNKVESDELIRWIRRRLLWVHGKLAAKARVAPQAKSPEFVNGESFSYLGRGFRLKVVKDQGKALNFDGARFLLRSDSRAKAAEHFRRWYRQTGTEWLRSRVQLLAPRVGARPANIRVRDLGFRWASCGRARALSFHWKLLQLPVRLVDYVIVHELTHLLHPRHDADFWACVERAMPDWRERKEQISEYATRYLSFGG